MSSLHATTMHTYHAQNRKLEALEISVLSVFKKSLLDRPLAQFQSISAAAAPFKCATIYIPNNTEVEQMTPPTKDMEVDPLFLDSTTMGIADTLPIYHTAGCGLLEGNPCSSDVKDEN